MAAKPTEEWCNSSPVKIDDGGLSSDKSTSYEEEAHPYRRSDGTGHPYLPSVLAKTLGKGPVCRVF